MAMEHNLPGLPAAVTDSHAVDHVVKPTLKELQKVMACLAGHFGGLLVEPSELALVHAVKPAKFLLLA
jgi:hypothetical protein